MDNLLAKRIEFILNEELVRRLLNKYFAAKGLNENMERPVYPPCLQDMGQQVPQIAGKVEIVPSIRDIDPNGGEVKVEWNLFVLGTNRMLLGESNHKNLAELRQCAVGPVDKNAHSIKKVTPKQIVEFITKILGNSESGMISRRKDQESKATAALHGKTSFGGSQGFEQNRPVL